MKQTFTLFAAFACSILTGFGQTTSENFETNNSLAQLQGQCWQFFNVKVLAATTVNGSYGLAAQPVDKINNATIITPYVNLTASSILSFQYRMQARNSSSDRVITVRLQDLAGTYYPVDIVTIEKGTDPFTGTFTGTSPQNGVFKIVLTIDGSGGGSNDLYIDNFNFGGELNYNTPYNCNSAATLPLQLKSFQGLVAADKAQLAWTVAQNETGSHFEVEKSADGRTFNTIAVVHTTNATGDAAYAYNDAASSTAYYRLKLVSQGKASTYSQVLFLKNQGSATTNAISLLQNPVQASLRFSFVSQSNSATEIAVYNMTGAKVYHTSFPAHKGTNQLNTTLDGSIQSGTYVLEVTNPTTRSVAKFVKH